MSGNAINNVLKKAKDPRFREFTAHGMRSTVADALAEVEGITSEERRRILHQATGNKVDAAYFRSPIIARQFQLLNIWSDLLHGRRAAEVIDLRARQAQTVGNS
jgi:integrase